MSGLQVQPGEATQALRCARWGLEQVGSVGGTVLCGVCVKVCKLTENERKRSAVLAIQTSLASALCLLQFAPFLFGFVNTRICGRESKNTWDEKH